MTVQQNAGFLPTLLIFLPATGALLLSLIPYGEASEIAGRWWPVRCFAMLTTVATFAVSVYFLARFQTGTHNIQFAQHVVWLPSLGISYFVGVDGINVWLLVLCTSVMMLATFAACFMINRRVKAFLVLMLIAEAGMLGVFLSWNLFLFYIFWEVMLIPAYFLIGMWGETKRVHATTKFVIYTIFGSFIMLVGIFYLWATLPGHNLDIPYLMSHQLANGPQGWVFLAFMLALGIKAALFPFHSWAPDAYVEAPVPAAVLIAAVMGKTATFAMLRIVLPIFPHASNQFSGLIEILALIGILYAASLALVQNDTKKVLAYASVSHMNIIILGIFALNQQGIDGSILQMINHAVIMAGLFFVVAMMYARSGTRRLDEMSGLAKAFPVLAAFALLLFLAAMDLPGLGSFAGEFTILIGVFLSNAWFATLAALVTIVAAWYMVRWFQGIFHGTVGTQVDDDEERSELATPYEFPVRAPRISVDLRKFEWAVLVPIAAVIVWLGVIPKPVTDRTASSVAALTRTLAANRHTSISVAAPVPGSQGGNAGRDSVLVVKTRRVDHTPTNHGGAR